MSNPRRLSPLDVLITFIKNIRNLLPAFILLIFKLDDVNKVELLLVVLGLTLLVLILGFFSFMNWRRFQYSLQQDRLVIHKGVFNREEKTIYYHRIHSVNVHQPLLLRIFGAASLQIETPGGQPGKAEGELRVLKHAYAIELQKQLRQLRIAGQATQAGQTEEGLAGKAEAGQVIFGQAEQEAQAWEETSERVEVEHDLRAERASRLSSVDLASQEEQRGPNQHLAAEAEAAREDNRDDQPQYQFRISFGQLLFASLTSLNLNFALIFIFGIYSFADDILNIISPGLYDKLFDSIIDQTSALPIFLLIVLAVLVLGCVWLLSIIIYLIKFGDYQIIRNDEQLSVSYGLLEKKSYIFDQGKVQAVIMEENLLRQWLGFAELRVQVITSSTNEQLVIHPFVRKKDILSIMSVLLPDYRLVIAERLDAPPSTAFRNYVMLPTIIVILLVAGAVWLWEWSGLFVLLALPVVWAWCYYCLRSSGVRLDGKDLTLRSRKINLITYFVRRKNIVTLKLKSSPMQRKRGLHNIHVQVLGSYFAYRVKGISNKHSIPIWSWYSRNGKRNSIEQ